MCVCVCVCDPMLIGKPFISSSEVGKPASLTQAQAPLENLNPDERCLFRLQSLAKDTNSLILPIPQGHRVELTVV